MSCCGKCNIPEFKFALRKDLSNNPEFIPARATETDTGWDVRCAEHSGLVVKPFQYVKIRLGFRVFSPEGWWLELRPRSSSHAKKHLNCLYGVIDSEYENELILSAQYLPPLDCLEDHSYGFLGFDNDEPRLNINFGDKIGQIIPVKRKVMTVEEVTNEEFDKLCAERGGKRGSGGFGSTG